MRLRALEQPAYGVARERRRVERGGPVSQAGMRGDGVGAGHGEELATPLVQHRPDVEERLQSRAEPAPGAAHALGDRADPSVMRRVQMEDPVGLAVADRAQDNRFGLQQAGQDALIDRPRVRPRTEAILFEAMKNVTVYTTDSCSLCLSAKALLERRGIQYAEVNLSRDADGREQLQRVTGMFSFPQILIGEEVVGG